MRIFAEDTAALIIDFQEKLVPAIANNEEIVAKAATFVAGVYYFYIRNLLAENVMVHADSLCSKGIAIIADQRTGCGIQNNSQSSFINAVGYLIHD